MARIIEQEAPTTFSRSDTGNADPLKYSIELITPMAGGGVEPWKPDMENPVRTSEIKGQLRFWWRSMQSAGSPEALKEQEDALWGGTGQASLVRLSVMHQKITDNDIITIPENDKGNLQYQEVSLPGYVLFPLESAEGPCRLIRNLSFQLTVQCPARVREAVENSLKLWILFGGLGARTTRGCGSLYCKEIMDSFSEWNQVIEFLSQVSAADCSHSFGESPFPVLHKHRLAYHVNPNKGDSQAEWNSFLTAYGKFRQGPGIGRNAGHGRTRWPEADAIRLIGGPGTYLKKHEPEHPAKKWFPRGAYGMPLKIEFKGEPPNGSYTLLPRGKGRWPSPVILKVIKLNENTIIKVCLILNQKIPDNLIIEKKKDKVTSEYYPLKEENYPLASNGKKMPKKATIMHKGLPDYQAKNPYDALIEYLSLTEV